MAHEVNVTQVTQAIISAGNNWIGRKTKELGESFVRTRRAGPLKVTHSYQGGGESINEFSVFRIEIKAPCADDVPEGMDENGMTYCAIYDIRIKGSVVDKIRRLYGADIDMEVLDAILDGLDKNLGIKQVIQ